MPTVVDLPNVALYAVVKKGVEIRVDPAPARAVNGTWSFLGPLTGKAVEHQIYVVRFEPASGD